MNFPINLKIKEFWEVKANHGFSNMIFHIGGKLHSHQYTALVGDEVLLIAGAECYASEFSLKMIYVNIRYYYDSISYSEKDMLKILKLKAFI